MSKIFYLNVHAVRYQFRLWLLLPLVKNISVFILLATLTLPLFLNTGVMSYYSVNIKAFTEKYCSNLDQPELHCNGKCKLKQIVINTDSNPNSKEKKNAQFLKLPLFYKHHATYAFKQSHKVLSSALKRPSNPNFLGHVYLEIPSPPPRQSLI